MSLGRGGGAGGAGGGGGCGGCGSGGRPRSYFYWRAQYLSSIYVTPFIESIGQLQYLILIE